MTTMVMVMMLMIIIIIIISKCSLKQTTTGCVAFQFS